MQINLIEELKHISFGNLGKRYKNEDIEIRKRIRESMEKQFNTSWTDVKQN